MTKTAWFRLAMFGCVAAMLATPAAAQEWPSRPIKVVTALAPGGAVDALVRTVGEELTTNLKQPVIVENRPGGGGSVAAISVARAAPDGYTLLLGSAGPLNITPLITKNVGYDTLTDFTPLTLAVELPIVLVVHKDFPANNVAEFVAYAKANPGKISFGSSGTHTTHHIAGEFLKAHAALNMVHIPYRGGNPAMTDLLAGQIPALFATLSTTLPHIDGGNLKVIGMIEAKRSIARPEIPTIGETVKGYSIPSSWLGYVGPPNMPAPLTQKIHTELVKAINTPSVTKALEKAGFEVITSKSTAEFGIFIKDAMERYRKIVAESNIEAQ